MRNKIKFTALALGLAVTAMMQANNSSAAVTCEQQCHQDYQQCQVICSKNPCFVSCQFNYDNCLNACGSES